jgi:transcriptional regulator with PAS, ATPase and Fis domain
MAKDTTGATQTAERTDDEAPRVFAFWPGGAVSAELPAPGAEVVVGRDATSQIRIPHESVSRTHAILRGGEPPTIRDAGSHNGTSIGGRRLERDERAPLVPNQVVKLGSASLIVQGGRSRLPDPREDAHLDPAMSEVLRLIDLVANSDVSVVLLGETGVGKEVLAARVHAGSARASGPFVRINCAALADSLLESELFGHERGAFTGAVAAKAGLFESAEGGTIFLDEIGETPAATQVKLLRVLETREVMRVGGLKPRAVDVRVVAATHRDLPERVAGGAFREDLWFRLNGMTIAIPPLRERKSEILPLAARFVREACARASRQEPAIAAEVRDRLVAYDWPGNVRELKTTMERAVVLAQGGQIDVEHVLLSAPQQRSSTARVNRDTQPVMPAAASLPDAVSALEKQRIEEALRACNGNQTAAAKMLGISRRTLVYRLGALGLRR